MAHKKKKKKKHRGVQTLPLSTLQTRIERALHEHRTQQALELAKTLHKQEPTQANKELLKRASMARARDLKATGHFRNAAVIFFNMLHLDDSAPFQAEIIKEIAWCGDLAGAIQSLARLPDGQAEADVLPFICDEALRQGPSAKQHLPATLHHDFDLIFQAFADSAAGRDEEAREKLRGVGLRSPFVEWRLLLRGLMAYYQNDDERAIENWQRLNPNRWPFRLAAPLRFGVDRQFAAEQPQSAHQALQRQSLGLKATPLVHHLQTIRRDIANENKLSQSFRSAEKVMPVLKEQAPEVIPRLARCFYWAIIHHGRPEDKGRYLRVFGPPADDPELTRLEAMAFELRGDMDLANRNWQRFEKSLLQSKHWPHEHKARLRAMIWHHMGENAESVPEFEEEEEDFFFSPFGRRPRAPKKPRPSAVECFERALELAPDQLSAHRALVHCHLEQENDDQAEKAVRRLLKHVPDDVPSVELLGDLLMKSGKYAEALNQFEQALHANPLEQRTRQKLGNAYAYHARTLAEQGRFDEARSAYQSALHIDDRSEKYPTLCKWAACEFKAGCEERAGELLEQAFAEEDSRLAVVFHMLVETIRFKLTKLKPQFNREFNKLLAEPPHANAAMELARLSAQLRLAGVTYYGQQTHEKKIRSYLEKARELTFDLQQLEKICAALAVLKYQRLQDDYVLIGQRQFPEDPFFYLTQALNELERSHKYDFRPWIASSALKEARERAQKLPRSDRREDLMAQIQEAELHLQKMSPFSGLFQGIFGGSPFDPFGMDDDDDFDDDFEDDEYYF